MKCDNSPAWRFREELEDLGYEITERQQTTNH